MIKTLTVCAALAALVALPAQAATEVTVKLTGKTPQSIQNDIAAAADKVCSKDMPLDYDFCVKATIASTLSKISDLKA